MAQAVERVDEVIAEFRQMLPAGCSTAMAIDGHEPLEKIAQNAVNDGYIERPDQLVSFIEVCVRRDS